VTLLGNDRRRYNARNPGGVTEEAQKVPPSRFNMHMKENGKNYRLMQLEKAEKEVLSDQNTKLT
jgi:hypothetical protein